jgi:hypothetical protein
MKTKQIFAIGTLLVTMLFFTACDPKEQALNDLQEFTQYLEQNKTTFTAEQWDQSLIQYDEICQAISQYETEYTSAEQNIIGRNKGRCQVIFAKHAVEDGVGGFIKELNEYKGLFEGVLEGLNGAFEEYK